MQIAKTKKCQAELEQMLKDTTAALAWATNNQQGAAAAAAALAAQAEAKRQARSCQSECNGFNQQLGK